MKIENLSIFILTSLLFVQCVFGQTAQTILNPPSSEERTRIMEQRRADVNRINEKLSRRNNVEPKTPPRKISNRLPRIKPNGKLTKEEMEAIKAILEPNPEDVEKYREFLKQPNTGLFRLFPNYNCEQNYSIRIDGECENFVPGGWAYSFRAKKHAEQDFKDFFDIRLEDEFINADGFLAQEILVHLGEIPLEDVTLQSKGMRFLNTFNPTAMSADVKKQFDQIAAVVNSDGYKYSKKTKALENSTYALRVVAYSIENKNAALPIGKDARDKNRYQTVNDDKRMDLTIAFRVIRRDEDKSITVLWKELKRQDSPQLKFDANAAVKNGK